LGFEDMKAHYILPFVFATTTLTGSSVIGADKAGETRFPSVKTSSALREGVWVWRSGHHLQSMVVQKVVKIAESDAKWHFTRFTLSHTNESFREKQQPEIKTEGPYPIHLTNGLLHIQGPNGVITHSCRFYGDLLQFPAVVRADAKTFNFTFSQAKPERAPKAEGIDTWSYTWICSSDPSQELNGKASLLAISPKGKSTVACVYTVEKHLDGPALVFKPVREEPKGEDRIVWHRKYFGPQVYNSFSPRLEGSQCPQMTYMPAAEYLKKLIEVETKEEPNKPDAGDGK
jgi:hypothetical protein